MRIPTLFMSLAVTVACLRASAQSPADADEQRWNITAECQMIIVSQKAAMPLLPALLDNARIEGAYEKLQQMIAAGEAELASQLVAKFRDGDKATSQTVEEFRYATQFDPPSLPSSENPAMWKDWPLVGITPTSFETRNVGATFEIEASVYKTPRHLVKVDVTLQHVRFLRWNKTDAGKLAKGDRLFVEQPIFHSMTNKANSFLKNGERVLLGVHKMPEQTDKLELFIMRIEAKPQDAK